MVRVFTSNLPKEPVLCIQKGGWIKSHPPKPHVSVGVRRYDVYRFQIMGGISSARLMLHSAKRRVRNVLDFINIARQTDNKGCVLDEFHRGRLVQSTDDFAEAAIIVNLHE